MARCVDCHGSHDVSHPTTELYVGTGERHCGGCHGAESKQVRLAVEKILTTHPDRRRAKTVRKVRVGQDISKIKAFEASQAGL
jgi:hypothetical protein